MFDSDQSALDPGLILTAAADTTRSLNLLEARKLELACAWADAHSFYRRPGPARHRPTDPPRRRRHPAVAEFAPAEFGAACGESPYRAKTPDR